MTGEFSRHAQIFQEREVNLLGGRRGRVDPFVTSAAQKANILSNFISLIHSFTILIFIDKDLG